MGFGADIRSKNQENIGETLKKILPEDLLKFGLIPEFIGRVPVVVSLEPLDEDALVRVLTEPQNALVKQYQKLFELDGVTLEITEEAVKAVARQAMKRNTGARGLRSIMEGLMQDLMYEIPSREDIGKCVITEDVIEEAGQPTLIPKEELYEDAGVNETA